MMFTFVSTDWDACRHGKCLAVVDAIHEDELLRQDSCHGTRTLHHTRYHADHVRLLGNNGRGNVLPVLVFAFFSLLLKFPSYRHEHQTPDLIMVIQTFEQRRRRKIPWPVLIGGVSYYCAFLRLNFIANIFFNLNLGRST